MAVNTRSREVMLPALFFPIIVPVIIGAVEATGMALGSDDSSNLMRWATFSGRLRRGIHSYLPSRL